MAAANCPSSLLMGGTEDVKWEVVQLATREKQRLDSERGGNYHFVKCCFFEWDVLGSHCRLLSSFLSCHLLSVLSVFSVKDTFRIYIMSLLPHWFYSQGLQRRGALCQLFYLFHCINLFIGHESVLNWLNNQTFYFNWVLWVIFQQIFPPVLSQQFGSWLVHQ